jgi:hypothetical protein
MTTPNLIPPRAKRPTLAWTPGEATGSEVVAYIGLFVSGEMPVVVIDTLVSAMTHGLPRARRALE